MDTKAKKSAILTAVALVMLTTAIGAQAQQNSFQGRFTLPFEVRWGNSVLPAGDYSIVIPLLNLPGTVRSLEKDKSFGISIGHVGDLEAKTAYLTVVSRNGGFRVTSMNLPSLNLSLMYAPITESEHKPQVAMRFPLK